MSEYSGAEDGRSGGSFSSPARPENHTPGREGTSWTGTDGAPGDDVSFPKNGDLNPTGYEGWKGHEERSSLDTATGLAMGGEPSV